MARPSNSVSSRCRRPTSSTSGNPPATANIGNIRNEGILETIFQSIEILSKEKGIDPQIVLDAVKDAMLIAARKHYRTNEDYVADMDPKTGAISLFAVKKVADPVED